MKANLRLPRSLRSLKATPGKKREKGSVTANRVSSIQRQIYSKIQNRRHDDLDDWRGRELCFRVNLCWQVPMEKRPKRPNLKSKEQVTSLPRGSGVGCSKVGPSLWSSERVQIITPRAVLLDVI